MPKGVDFCSFAIHCLRASKSFSALPEVVLGLVQALRPNSPVASLPEGAKQVLHVNGFNIDYRPDGSVQQFNSDLSILDQDGQQMQRTGIFVKKPLRCLVPLLHRRHMSPALQS